MRQSSRCGAPRVVPLGETELDPAALFFVSYDGIVNNASYQQSGILSHRGWQYAAWYTASRHATVARRALPDGCWQAVRLAHRLHVDDSHNTISLGISPLDGRLHVAMDTHDNRVFYTCSRPGLAAEPGRHAFTPADFGPVLRVLGGPGLSTVDIGDITYPRFLITPHGGLQLSYRTGRSGDGSMELAEFDGSGWTALGAWSSPAGEYRHNGAVSPRRNLYLHGLAYGPGERLHAAFTWREDNAAVLSSPAMRWGRSAPPNPGSACVLPGSVANHDTGYVRSDDCGRSWCSATGERVAVTGSDSLVCLDSPGVVVDPLGVDHALINQESIAVDSAGQPHVAISYVPVDRLPSVTDMVTDRRAHGAVFHLYRRGDGSWHKTRVPVPLAAFGRSQLVLDNADDAYLVMPYGRIATASAASGWSDWTLRFDAASLNVFGEVVVDRARVASDGVLSVMYQCASGGLTPSPLRVADFRLS